MPTVRLPLPDQDNALAPRALYQDVAERLRQQIFNRELEPGSWIDEQKLSAEYGISRTPLREALKVLAVAGLGCVFHPNAVNNTASVDFVCNFS